MNSKKMLSYLAIGMGLVFSLLGYFAPKGSSLSPLFTVGVIHIGLGLLGMGIMKLKEKPPGPGKENMTQASKQTSFAIAAIAVGAIALLIGLMGFIAFLQNFG